MSLPVTLRRTLLVAVALLTTVPTAMAQSTDAPMEKYISYRVLIGPDGKLVSATPLDSVLGIDIQRAALGLAKDLKFEPAQSQGKPASAESSLSIVVQFKRKPDNSYRLELRSARLATEAVKRVPPVYRMQSGKSHGSAIIVLGLLVRADGSVDASQTRVLQSAISGGKDADLATMTAASREAIAQWKFKPDLVAGQPVSTMNSMVMRFCAPGLGGCDKPAEPAPSTDMLGLPRSMTPGSTLPVLHRAAALAKPALEGETDYVQMRIAVNALGAVTSLRPVGKLPRAEAVDAVRKRLQAAPFLPAQSAGKAVSSEMTVTVPVRDERAGGGILRVQLERIRYDFQLVAAPSPWIPQEMSRNGIDARTRFRVVIGPDGRADRSQSKVEMLELSPNAPGMRRKLEANILDAIRYIRVEPVLVDGKNVPISFIRGMYFCSDTSRPCAFSGLDEATMKAIGEPPSLPPGVTLARLAPSA